MPPKKSIPKDTISSTPTTRATRSKKIDKADDKK